MLADGDQISESEPGQAELTEGLTKELTAVNAEIRKKETVHSAEAAEARAADRGHGQKNQNGQYESAILRPDQSLRSYWTERGMINPRTDIERPSAGAQARSLVTGPRTEGETRSLAEGLDATGGISVDTVTAAEVFDTARAQSVVFRAGARTVPMTTESHIFAKTTKDPTMVYRAEAGSVAESDPTFAGIVLTAKSFDVYFKASREVLEDSVNINEAIQLALVGAAAVGIDNAALVGSSPGVVGVANHLDVGQVAGAATLDWNDILDGFYELWKNNHEATGIVVSPRERLAIAKMKGAVEGNPLITPPAIAAVPIFSTSVMPATDSTAKIVVGDFTKMLIGIRAQLRIAIARELFAETGQIGFFANLRIDVALSYPKAFAVIGDITS